MMQMQADSLVRSDSHCEGQANSEANNGRMSRYDGEGSSRKNDRGITND